MNNFPWIRDDAFSAILPEDSLCYCFRGKGQLENSLQYFMCQITILGGTNYCVISPV